jgi:PKD domain
MIVVECLHDGDALPWQADWYRRKVEAIEGPGADEKFRLFYVDNANHTDPTNQSQQTHAVGYSGTVQFALRELSSWVERDVAPPPTTRYEVHHGQVHVPSSAAERRGIQPVVHLAVGGGERADVETNEVVTFSARIEVPPGPGTVVSARWDFEGEGTYADAADLGARTSKTVELAATHAFSTPGTYFPALRVCSQHESNPDTPFARSLNLARVRVVVHD